MRSRSESRRGLGGDGCFAGRRRGRSRLGSWERRVDPDLVGRPVVDRAAVRKTLGVGGERPVQGALAGREDGFDAPEVDVGRREEGDATVAVLVVVP